MQRLCLAALLGSSMAVGCERAATRTPPDPLLVSKKPVPGKNPDAEPEPVAVALGEPSAPPMPLSAVASGPPLAGSAVSPDPERDRYRPRLSISAKTEAEPPASVLDMPVGTSEKTPAAALALPVSHAESSGQVTGTLAVRRQVAGTYGHAADYSWLQGVLRRDYHGQIALRYCDHTVDDTHGGKVVLRKDPRLDDFKDGDVILVEGEIAQENGQPVRCDWNHFPHYQVRNVWLVEHGQ